MLPVTMVHCAFVKATCGRHMHGGLRYLMISAGPSRSTSRVQRHVTGTDYINVATKPMT
jgi:hypothetical protein